MRSGNSSSEGRSRIYGEGEDASESEEEESGWTCYFEDSFASKNRKISCFSRYVEDMDDVRSASSSMISDDATYYHRGVDGGKESSTSLKKKKKKKRSGGEEEDGGYESDDTLKDTAGTSHDL